MLTITGERPATGTRVAVILVSWGAALAGAGPRTGSLAWAVHDQALYLSGLLAIGLMSLSMVLATRPEWLERPFGGMDRIYLTHRTGAILAVGFGVLRWRVEMSDDLVKALVGRAGRVPQDHADGLMHVLRDAGEEFGEFARHVVIAMLLPALWRRFPCKRWRYAHRAMPALPLSAPEPGWQASRAIGFDPCEGGRIGAGHTRPPTRSACNSQQIGPRSSPTGRRCPSASVRNPGPRRALATPTDRVPWPCTPPKTTGLESRYPCGSSGCVRCWGG